MNPDDRAALATLKDELGKLQPGAHQVLGTRVPWLLRIVDELDARVLELEAGGVPAVIAKKDAAIAERDAALAKQAEHVAKLEKEKLPDPSEFFRSTEPIEKVKEGAVSPAEDIATPTNAPKNRPQK